MGKQLNIKTDEARELAEELARQSGETITEAVTESLRQRLRTMARDRARMPDALRQREIEFYDIVDGSRARWKGAMVSIDYKDLLYDEYGLPR